MTSPKKSPVDSELLTSLAKRFADREMFDEADEMLQLALRFAPNNMGIQLNLAEVRKHRRASLGDSARDAKEVVREEMRRAAIDSAHFFGLAALYEERGKPDLATECLEIACRREMINPFAHKLNGKLLFRNNSFDEAGRELRRAQRYNPFDREISDLLGRVEYEREHYAEALEATIDAFLLLQDDDRENARHLKKRIRTLKTIRRISGADLVQLFRQRREKLQTAFERLELLRERILADEEMARKVRLMPRPKPESGRLELAQRLRGLEAWTNLDDEQIFQLAQAASEAHFEKDETIFPFHSEGAEIFVLEKGQVQIHRPTAYGNYLLGTLGPGSVLGEINFIHPGERTGQAVAVAGSDVIRLDPDELELVIQRHPELGVQLYWGFWHSLAQKLRSANEELRTFFSEDTASDELRRQHRSPEAGTVEVGADDKIELLREQGLTGTELETLADLSSVKRYPGGTYLFHEGDEGQEMYVVLEGRVMISKFIPGGGEEALAILDRGDFFGEMSLIDGEPRSADAKAFEGPATVVTFDQPTLSEIMTMDPRSAHGFLVLLCRLICKRLREIDEKVVSWRIMAGVRPGESEGMAAAAAAGSAGSPPSRVRQDDTRPVATRPVATRPVATRPVAT